ncbi:MAG TPA: AMP-binding protein [Terriglobales bacterium]|jgi:long-chain acyl-CoA synthetase
MSFLEDIFAQLEAAGDTILLRHESARATGRELQAKISAARAFLRSHRLKNGDRCALLSANSIDWVALDLAIIAEGLIVVPLYARQAPAELVAMMKDCSPAAICCGDASLREAILKEWAEAPQQFLFSEIFATTDRIGDPPVLADSDPVAVIYTSGTSGEAKGVVLTAGNVAHMLSCTSARLDLLMRRKPLPQDRVFHYLPFVFAGSWIMLLTCLLRGSLLTLNSDLSKISNEMRESAADYFLNVPALLERMRKAVDEQLWKTGGPVQWIYSKAKNAAVREHEGKSTLSDTFWSALAEATVFPTIRNKMIGPNLRALICGSAPLNVDTQLFFIMLGIPVLQVYGLTETTAICTMDDPRDVVPGRTGPAISGIEMKLGENDEIIVSGPNIFHGYWHRPEETAKVLHDGWFHTGDQGEVDAKGNWRIIGRIKNLIILGSGHNIAPEPIEDEVLKQLPGAQQVVLVGNGRGYLSAIVTGDINRDKVQRALDAVNPNLPHYKQVRAFHIHNEPFSIDNGMLTANGKLKRDLISQRLQPQIEELYQQKQAS